MIGNCWSFLRVPAWLGAPGQSKRGVQNTTYGREEVAIQVDSWKCWSRAERLKDGHRWPGLVTAYAVLLKKTSSSIAMWEHGHSPRMVSIAVMVMVIQWWYISMLMLMMNRVDTTRVKLTQTQLRWKKQIEQLEWVRHQETPRVSLNSGRFSRGMPPADSPSFGYPVAGSWRRLGARSKICDVLSHLRAMMPAIIGSCV